MNVTVNPDNHALRALAVIPARGGSRRIPQKNLAKFCGTPALAHVVRIARESAVFERVAVSTDDPAIASCAENSGADVIWRPAHLADDDTPLQPAVVHAMEAKPETDLVCLLLATAVLLKPTRLAAAYNMLSEDPTLEYVIGIRRFESAPQRGMKRDEAGLVSMRSPENFNVRSQDLVPLYHDAGQFSFGRASAWLSDQPSFTMRTYGLELPRGEAVDIDVPEDLAVARALFEARAAE